PFAQTPQFPPGRSAFAFRPSDMVLAGRVDAALAGFIGTTPYHDLLRLFGFGSEATPQENRQ
ncbi:MAG: ABC transporter substrate-binding protein, partial [Solidesulfovibrio sp.]|nr:ABC transporter substrate-binding protein [Solidesulfovibrio sp.]